MPPLICPDCHADFTPTRYFHCCDECGDELSRQYERLRDFDDHEWTLAELAGRVVWGERPVPRAAWKSGRLR